MGTVNQLRNAMNQLNLRRIAIESIRQTEADLITAQQDQMYSGLLITGLKIKPAYRKRTKSIKKGKGQPIDRVTLKDTGDFYNAIQVVVGSNVVGFMSKDIKTKWLEKKYTNDIFGLNKKSIKKYKPALTQIMAKNIIKKLGL